MTSPTKNGLVETNFPRGTTNQKLYPDLGSDTSSVWHSCARFPDVISRGNRWWFCETSAVFLSFDILSEVAFQQEKRNWVSFFRGWTHAIRSTTLGVVQPTSSGKVKGASPTRAHIISYFRVSLIYTSCRKKNADSVNHFLNNLAFTISGPHRMRKKMYRNDMFYLHYPYDPKVAKLVRQVWKLVWK